MKKGVEIFSLSGKRALITGATGHLGTAMAWILAEAGAKVLINSRSPKRSKELANQLNESGYSAESTAFDITSLAEINHFASSLYKQPLNILINNAYSGSAGSIETSNDENYIDSYGVTMIGAHRLFTTLLPNLRSAVKECGDASVINIASMYALVSPDLRIYESKSYANPPFYGAAKAALLQWTRYAGCEFGREGIRVNAISPGPFPSQDVQENSSELVASLSRKVPLGRIGEPDEIRGAVLFLASAASTFVNASNIVIDGGWTSW